ncbi:hypothetical protein [Shimia abyssi]|uniref:Uncharacterized protein n=1 Tax=Shimia abyssi TaxID=1662395 RepID=A0A2P8FJ69_9RHOB|nr:hypothetical protein [Shimia abyssi]PSL21761.1 hypothetical protein CLV88_101185 [Shimia abyssi]
MESGQKMNSQRSVIGALGFVLGMTFIASGPVAANEIEWKCGYISKASDNYTYRNVRVRGYPDKLDCQRELGGHIRNLVLTVGFVGETSDAEVRTTVAEIANGQK